MRILIGPAEVAGIGSGLKAGFDALGVCAEVIFSQDHPFYPGHVRAPLIARIWQRLSRLANPSTRRSAWLRLPFWFVWRVWGVAVLLWAVVRFDSFIFLFGNTLTNLPLEAWLLRLLRKRVVVIYCGSDARPPYIDGLLLQAHPKPAPEQILKATRKRAERVQMHERYGFVAVNSASTGHFHAQPFLNWFAMGLPRAIAAPSAEGSNNDARAAVRILHSPSNKAVKGTTNIVRAIDELRAHGHDIELVMLHGVSNEEVKDELARCDLVVDQLYSDTPLAAFGVEAAFFGKPAIVCGYAAAAEHLDLIGESLPPSRFVLPDKLSDAIEELIRDADARRELGLAAQAFVSEKWNPKAVASRYLAALTRSLGGDVNIDPMRIRYVHGCGIAEPLAQATVRQMIESHGLSSLAMDHNPALRGAFLAFAGLPPERNN